VKSELVIVLFIYMEQPILVNRPISNTLPQSPALLLPSVCIEKCDQIRKSEYEFFVFRLTVKILAVYLRTAMFKIKKFHMVHALRLVFCTDLRTDSGLWCIRH